MSITGGVASAPIRLRRYIWALAGFWTVAIAVVLTWRLMDERNQAIDIAQSEAEGAWKKEVAVIRWAADSGTVYVPVTDKTPPDPNLAYLSERDVSTSSGQKLTAISPPMIMDQVHALSQGQSGFKGHIASLKSVRPENSPDPWEKQALEAFGRGASEVSTEDSIGGRTYFRLMRPLLIDESCMHCHAKQGYKVGDIRGGLTISVPMDPALEKQNEETVHRILGYSGIWILGLCGIALMSRQLQHQVEHRSQAERMLQEAHDVLEHRVVERTSELAQANQQLQNEVAERKQAELWLLESEQRFRGYFEQGLVGMAILSVDKECLEVNQQLCKLLDYTEIELIGKSWTELTHPDDLPAEESQFKRILGGVINGFVMDKRFVRKDGKFLYARISMQCMEKEDKSIDCILALVQDMADRKSKEEKVPV
jgi:PAS domain S-box-containing protein